MDGAEGALRVIPQLGDQFGNQGQRVRKFALEQGNDVGVEAVRAVTCQEQRRGEAVVRVG